jgi:hypothetical protein
VTIKAGNGNTGGNEHPAKPADRAAEPDGIISRLGQALRTIEQGHTPDQSAPHYRHGAAGSRETTETRETIGADLVTDPTTADAADMAGRLRPAILIK